MLVVDCDYNFNKLNDPVIRIFGKIVGREDEGEDAVLHVLGMEPYFYIDDCNVDIFELKKLIENVLKGYAKRIDIVKRFKPVGYQIEKSNMLKIVLFNPKTTPAVREMLKEKISEVTNSNLYEADIPFRNRYMIDAEINGMDVIEFPENKIPNYGINCNRLFICNKDAIKVLKEELVNIEY